MVAKKSGSNSVSGSLSRGEPEYLEVGYLRRPHGVHGEMIMEVHTDFPERLEPGTGVYISDVHRRMIISGTRFHKDGLIIKFEELNSPEEAGLYRNQSVYVRTADRPRLPEGKYYHHELIGFSVVDERGGFIGFLTEILQTGANDVYVVKQDGGGEILLPVISSVILAMEIDLRQIRVRLIPGLLDE